MYFTIGQKVLSAAVNAMQTIASGKTLQPILKHLLLEASAQGVFLRASNGETTIHYRVAADVQASGTVLLPVHLFAGFVQDLPSAPITLVSPSPTDPLAVQMRCRQVKANIRQGAMPVEEFPLRPQLEAGCRDLLTVDCELLRETIEQVAFAAATDHSRPVLEGIRVAFADGRASFGAADAFRLAVRSLAIPDPALSAEVIIPAQTMRQVARLLPTAGAVRIALTPTGNQVLFHAPTMDIATRLIEGAFPNFSQLVAMQTTTQVVLPTDALAAAVHLMEPFARENKHMVRLQVQQARPGEPAALVLAAEAPDLGANEMCLNDTVTVSGPDLSLTVNVSWLADSLGAIVTPQVSVEFTTTDHPLVVRPVGPLECVHVIMPLFCTPPSPSRPVPAAQGHALPGPAATR